MLLLAILMTMIMIGLVVLVVVVEVLTVHKMLILPMPQHPRMQTGSGFLVGTL